MILVKATVAPSSLDVWPFLAQNIFSRRQLPGQVAKLRASNRCMAPFFCWRPRLESRRPDSLSLLQQHVPLSEHPSLSRHTKMLTHGGPGQVCPLLLTNNR